MTAIERKEVQGSQGKLATFSAGDGAGLTVVLLHADSGNSEQWLELQQQLGAERRVVALDFRGHGASEPAANDDYGYAGRAEDLARVADALDLGRFALVAHSGGAAVALEYALAHPERVAGLLLVDPPADPRALPRSVKEAMLKDLAGPNSLEVQKAFYASLAGGSASIRERVLRDCERVHARARLGVARALAQWNPEPTLNTWRGPLRILATANNDGGHALSNLRPDVEREIVPDVGHWLQLERPQLVLDGVRAFVAELERIEG
jgi:pimeloyl-ACP methyl ester carboxylesterase